MNACMRGIRARACMYILLQRIEQPEEKPVVSIENIILILQLYAAERKAGNEQKKEKKEKKE